MYIHTHYLYPFWVHDYCASTKTTSICNHMCMCVHVCVGVTLRDYVCITCICIYYVYAYGHPWTTLTFRCFQHVHCVTFICFSSACKTTTRRGTKKKLKTTRKNNIAQLLAGHPIDTRIKTSKNHEKVIRTTPENKQNGCNDVCQTWAFPTISKTLCLRSYCKWCPFCTVFICCTIVAWFDIFEAPQA